MKIEKLTEEQEALMDVVFQEYDAMLAPTEPVMADIEAWIKVVYGFYNMEAPKIQVVDSPFAALKLAHDLTGETLHRLDQMGVSDSGWVARYDYFFRIGALTQDTDTDNLFKLKAFMQCAWDTLLYDELAIVVRRPTRLDRDQEGRIHSEVGPAIEWADGNKDWSWHGVWVPQRVVEAPRSFTKEEYLAVTNAEIRRALGEAAGFEHICELLGAEPLDTWTHETTGLSYTLLGTDNERWLKMQSPELQTGEQPTYVEPVHENLKTAAAARKWRATTLTPEECERDPSLEFELET